MTERAILAFQGDQELTPTGEFDKATLSDWVCNRSKQFQAGAKPAASLHGLGPYRISGR